MERARNCRAATARAQRGVDAHTEPPRERGHRPGRRSAGPARALPSAPRRPLSAGRPVLSPSRINEKSVWCCGWLPCTPLRIAATAGHGNCVDFLIRKGAEVDLVDVKGQTALYVAVVNGHLESTQILLEAGADPNGSRHHRSTPVYHASRVGRADILQALIRWVSWAGPWGPGGLGRGWGASPGASPDLRDSVGVRLCCEGRCP